MCDPKNTKKKVEYESCGHTMPEDPCEHYSNLLGVCMAKPLSKNIDKKKLFDKEAKKEPGLCKFCREGKDIDGEYGYGKGWEERYNWPL